MSSPALVRHPEDSMPAANVIAEAGAVPAATPPTAPPSFSTLALRWYRLNRAGLRATAIGIVSLLVGPALVVIGGGLSRAGEGLLDPLRVALRQRTPVVHPADVTVSALGDRGGVIGAALLARDGWAPES